MQSAFLIALAAIFLSPAVAQNCPMPPVLQPLPPGINMFSDQQEADLGDAMAEQIAPRLTIIENDALTIYLRALGNRLVQHLPPSNFNFRFYLVDLPEPNAFSIAGGRVYVSRKLIIFAHSEDELAGVLAHELGHIMTHQSAIYMTRRLREVLGIAQVGDRTDVFTKYHQYLENYRRKPSKGESEQKEQSAADQVGLYTAFRSGYSPQSFVEILDRTEQTHGQTGSWISDLFGATKPGQRRLREAMRNMGTLSPACADPRSTATNDAFVKWKDQIAAYSDTGGQETLPGLVFRNALQPRLRPDVSNLRFSPDGKYILAQDEGGIHILTRAPLAVLFYVPAPDAHNAEFTPDSRSFVFYTRSYRVETWSIPDQTRTSVYEIAFREVCMQSALSYDGKTLACLDGERDLLLVDVATSTTFLTKKQFYAPSYAEALFLWLQVILKDQWEDYEFVQMKFSPDDHYFLAGHAGSHVTFDLTRKQEISLPGSIKDHIADGFAFLGTDQIVMVNAGSPEKSPILRFPSGERVDQLPLGRGLHMRAAARGPYLFVGPLKEQPLGLLNVSTRKLPISFKRTTADVYDDILVNERLDGEIALYPVGKSDPTEVITLPEARLGKLRAAAISPDLDWIAVSNRSRAAVWNVAANVRTQHIRGFQGAWFSDSDVLYADFAKQQNLPRSIAAISPVGKSTSQTFQLDDIVASQRGAFLLVTTPKGKGDFSDVDVEVRDITTNKALWSHHFAHELPGLSFNSQASTVLMGWSVAAAGGHERLQAYPDIRSQASKEDYLFELVDLRQGAAMGKLLVKTNKRSVRLEGSVSDGDWVVLSAEGSQILTFSLSNGVERGRYFGTAPEVIASAKLLALEKDAKELDLYDLESQQLKRKYVFSDPIALKRVSNDGKRIFVLTTSQTAYLLDTTSEE